MQQNKQSYLYVFSETQSHRLEFSIYLTEGLWSAGLFAPPLNLAYLCAQKF